MQKKVLLCGDQLGLIAACDAHCEELLIVSHCEKCMRLWLSGTGLRSEFILKYRDKNRTEQVDESLSVLLTVRILCKDRLMTVQKVKLLLFLLV